MTWNKNICSIYLDKYSTRYVMKHVYSIQLQSHHFIANAEHKSMENIPSRNPCSTDHEIRRFFDIQRTVQHCDIFL